MIDASLAINDLAGLSAAVPQRLPLDGRVGVSASLSGTLAHARATIAATSSGLDIAGQHIDRAAVDASADLDGPRFVIDRLTLSSGNGRLDGRGDVDLAHNTYTAHVTASDLPVTPLIGIADSDVPVSGRVNGSFDGEGSFSSLGGRGRVSLNAARWKDADLGNPTADVRLEGRNAVVTVDAPELALKANGSIGLDSTGTLAIRGDWTPNDVAAIQQRLALAPSTPINGSAGLRFEVNGTRDHLDELRGLVNFDALDVTVSGQAIRLVRPGSLEYDGRTARAGNIGFATGGSTLVLDGSIGDQAARGLTASLDGMLADFAFVRDLVRPTAGDADSTSSAGRLDPASPDRRGRHRPAHPDRDFSDRRRPCAADGGTGRHRHRHQREVRRRRADARSGERGLRRGEPHGHREGAEQCFHRSSARVPAKPDRARRWAGIAVGADPVGDAGRGRAVRRSGDARSARRPHRRHGPARSRPRGARAGAGRHHPRSRRAQARGHRAGSADDHSCVDQRRPRHRGRVGMGPRRQPADGARGRDARRQLHTQPGRDLRAGSARAEHPDAVDTRGGTRRRRDPSRRHRADADARRLGHRQQRRGPHRQSAGNRERRHGHGDARGRHDHGRTHVRLPERR